MLRKKPRLSRGRTSLSYVCSPESIETNEIPITAARMSENDEGKEMQTEPTDAQIGFG